MEGGSKEVPRRRETASFESRARARESEQFTLQSQGKKGEYGVEGNRPLQGVCGGSSWELILFIYFLIIEKGGGGKGGEKRGPVDLPKTNNHLQPPPRIALLESTQKTGGGCGVHRLATFFILGKEKDKNAKEKEKKGRNTKTVEG